MTFKKKDYYTTLQKAKDIVPGFREAFSRFEEQVTINQSSKSLITNYGRNLAHLALHFGQVPHEVSVEEINSYLYRLTVHEQFSESFFKQTVFGLRYWFRLFGMEEKALKMPVIKYPPNQVHLVSYYIAGAECGVFGWKCHRFS